MNHLQKEKSPYLLQHAQNPVDWYPWCDAAFAQAKKEDKPIFLSIGYSTCHWCHVMAKESFEDTEVAAALNRDFICIKVDREERPDVDAVYMAVCQAMTGSGGWPLSIFMTSEQKPFFAGTYFPKSSAYGRVGMLELLEEIAQQWQGNRTALMEDGEKIAAFIAKENAAAPAEPEEALLARAAAQLSKSYDPKWGGFGRAPKFPMPHNLIFLLRYGAAYKAARHIQMAEHTLEAMARGGMFDHIGGGFARYSTDAHWLAPHFEKMLYDNALLTMAYLEAFRTTGRHMYRDVAMHTIEYVLSELRHPQGCFYCAQDADSGGREGGYYLFTPAEVRGVLGSADGEFFCRVYNITEEGNFEGANIPNLIGAAEDADMPELAEIRRKLQAYRRSRMELRVDDKAIVSWNGLMIAALANAYLVLGEQRYLQAAKQAASFIETHMAADGRLLLRWRDGEAAHMAQIDDYAFYVLALTSLYRATFDPVYLEQANRWATVLLDCFEDRQNGGMFLSARDAEQLIARPKEAHDGALPSGNSIAALALGRLARLTEEWRTAAQRQRRFLVGCAAEYPAGYCCALIAMLEALREPGLLVCCAADHAIVDAAKLAAQYGEETLTILCKTEQNAEALAKVAPFTAAYAMPASGAAYYLCRDGVCLPPAADPSEIEL